MALFRMREYIAESSSEAKKNSREKFIYGDKLVFLKDQLPYNFDLQYVLDTIEGFIPKSLVSNVDTIYVGKFKDLDSGEIPFNAKYKDGALYVTNDQETENVHFSSFQKSSILYFQTTCKSRSLEHPTFPSFCH